jgi:hypothetical protein
MEQLSADWACCEMVIDPLYRGLGQLAVLISPEITWRYVH